MVSRFGIKGVKEHACFLKEVGDAQKVRNRLMDCVETATFAGQTEQEIDRLLSFVVVGGGPTGVEYAGELSEQVRLLTTREARGAMLTSYLLLQFREG